MTKYFDQTFVTKKNLRRPLLAALMLAGVAYVDSAQAFTLPNGAELTINPGTKDSTGYVNGGSYFGMDQNGNSAIPKGEKTAIQVTGNIPIGSAIIASGSHSGAINSSESPAFDIWTFFANTGMDYLSTAATDTGGGLLNFSGWTVTWNYIPAIPMNARAWQPTNCLALGCTGHTFTDGIAWVHGWDGVNGHAYLLDYSATVPDGDPSGFGGVPYYLHLEGTVVLPPFTLTNDSASTLISTPVNINVTSNDSPAGYTIDSSSVAIVTNSTNGTAVANANNTVTYTPTGGFVGSDSFTYRVTGNGGIVSSPATVTVNIQAALPPTANDDSATANGSTPAPINVLSNDTNGSTAINPATVAITTAASHGSTSVNGTTGVVTYTANAYFSGSDAFQYTVSDATQTSTPATVTVTVRATTPASSTGTLSPGATAVANSSTTGGGLTATMVGTDTALTQQCVGGCFDFQVTGLTAGTSASVVLPLTAAIPTNAVYRKRVGGVWQDFSSAAGNSAASAAAVSAGPVCPEPGSSSYTSGLTPGNQCLKLTIKDGGANDDDSLANGTVLDPGGVGVKGAFVDLRTSSTSGCSLSSGRVSLSERSDWGLMLGFIAWLGMIIRRRQNHA